MSNQTKSIGAALGLEGSTIDSARSTIHGCIGIALLIISIVVLADGWKPDSLTLSATVGGLMLGKIFNELGYFGLSTTKNPMDPCYLNYNSERKNDIYFLAVWAASQIGLAILTYMGELSTTELAIGTLVLPFCLGFASGLVSMVYGTGTLLSKSSSSTQQSTIILDVAD